MEIAVKDDAYDFASRSSTLNRKDMKADQAIDHHRLVSSMLNKLQDYIVRLHRVALDALRPQPGEQGSRYRAARKPSSKYDAWNHQFKHAPPVQRAESDAALVVTN
jgi:hypothetical protein